MRNNALSVANYFIDIANSSNAPIQPLKLMKLVYIAYGFGLAGLGKSIIDYRFDKVEAWKFGPVIPSVYFSFKSYGKNPVTQKTVMWTDDDADMVTPELTDDDAKAVCDMVWRTYGNYTGSELVNILHSRGTPWHSVYVEGRNMPIPEEKTKRYYSYLLDLMVKRAKEDGQIS